MKKKILPLLLTFIMSGTLIGCGHRTPEIKTVVEEKIVTQLPTTSIYYLNDDYSKILSKEIEYETFDSNIIYNALVESNILAKDITVNQIKFYEKDGSKIVSVDFNGLSDYLKTLTNAEEFARVTAIANSYIDFFSADKFEFTNNNQVVTSKTRRYDSYLEKFTGSENPEFGNESTVVIVDRTDELKRANNLLKSFDSNAVLSPVSLKVQLLNVYDSADSNFDSLIGEVDVEKENVAKFAVNNKNFTNSIFYNEGLKEKVSFNEDFSQNINTFKGTLRGFDFGNTFAVNNANKYYDVPMFSGINAGYGLVEISTLDIVTDAGLSYKTNINNVDYLTGVVDAKVYDTDDFATVLVNDGNYSIALIKSKSDTKLSDVGLENVLDFYSLIDKKVKLSAPVSSVSKLNSYDSFLNGVNVYLSNSLKNVYLDGKDTNVSEIKQLNSFSINNPDAVGLTEELTGYEYEIDFSDNFTYVVLDETLNEVVLIGQIIK